MALEDLFELSAMIKMQLPILYSFCVIRWLVSVVARIGHRALTPKSLRYSAERCLQVADTGRRVAFVCLNLVHIYCVLTSPPPSDVCAEYANVRVQGVNAMLALAVIFGSGNLYATGLSLATLKSVADTSSASIVIASAACVAAVHTQSLVYPLRVALTSVCVWYSYACADAPLDTRGGPGLATAFTLLLVLADACRAACRGLKTLMMMMASAVSSVSSVSSLSRVSRRPVVGRP